MCLRAEIFMQLLIWLHKGQEHNSARRKFFYMKTQQKIKHESESNVRGYKLNAIAMLDLETHDTLLEIPVSSILNPVLCMILFAILNYV